MGDKKYNEKWIREHPEEMKGYRRKYNRTHKEQQREYKKRHRVQATARWSELRKAAKDRGLVVEISFEDFCRITSHPCFYCGCMSPGRDFTGIDRIDSTKGYIDGNVAPCCYVCNRMKSDMSIDEWFSKMEQILSH